MVIVPVAILGVAVIAFQWLTRQTPEIPAATPEPPTFLVGVETAQREPVTFEIRSQGTVSPRISTTMVAEVSGQITFVNSSFVTGGFFSQDDELLRIDPRNYETVLARAKLNVARAETRMTTETALTTQALEDWQRLRVLDPDLELPTDLALRKPQLEEVVAEYEAAQAELKKAEDDLERTTMRAPYNGMILQKLADVGQFVNTGFQLARTVAIDTAEVRLPISLTETEFVSLPSGTNGEKLPVTITTNIGNSRMEWKGNIVRTEGVIDEASRVIHAVAQIEDPYDQANGGEKVLRFGTFVSAKIQGIDAGELFVIPRHAIRNGTTMWIVMDDQTIQPREVSIVRSDENHSYVSNGIEEGDIYCVTPIDRPLPGMRVRIDG